MSSFLNSYKDFDVVMSIPCFIMDIIIIESNLFVKDIVVIVGSCIGVMSMNSGFISIILIMGICFGYMDYCMDYSLLIKNLNMNCYLISNRTK